MTHRLQIGRRLHRDVNAVIEVGRRDPYRLRSFISTRAARANQ